MNRRGCTARELHAVQGARALLAPPCWHPCSQQPPAWHLLVLPAGVDSHAAGPMSCKTEAFSTRPAACRQVSIAAKEHNVPVYVAAESYKFARCGGGEGAVVARTM